MEARYLNQLILRLHFSPSFAIDSVAENIVAAGFDLGVVEAANTATLFRPHTGLLAQFINESVTNDSWHGMALPFSKKFEQANKLYKNHYPFKLTLSMQPIPTPGTKEIIIRNNSQYIAYQNGPLRWYQFNIPSTQNQGFCQLSVFAVYGYSPHTVHFNGPWSCLRLLQKANFIKVNDGEWIATWKMRSGYKTYFVRFKFRVKDDQRVLFKALVFGKLTLPRSIFS